MANNLLSKRTGQLVLLPRARAWDSTTMTFGVPTNLGAGSGTVSAVTSESIDTLYVKLRFRKDATPGSGSSAVTFTMPAGYTIDFTKLTSYRYIGWGSFETSNYGPEADVVALTTTTFAVRLPGSASNIRGSDCLANTEVNLYLQIPIVEFSGGMLQYGAGLVTGLTPGLIRAQTPETVLVVTGTGWTTIRAVGIAYQDNNGIWRLRFNIFGAVTSSARSIYSIAITGIVSKTTSSLLQAINSIANTTTVVPASTAYIGSGTNNIQVEHLSAITVNYGYSGDIELDSKPAWA